METARFLESWTWHIFLRVPLLAIFAFAVWGRWNRRLGAYGAVLITVGACFLLTIVLGADVSFLRPSADAAGFGQESRFMIAAITPLTILLAATGAWIGAKAAKIAAAATALWAFASFADYYASGMSLIPSGQCSRGRSQRRRAK